MTRLVWSAAILALTAVSAAAHAPLAGGEGFYGGLLHPLLVPTHAVALTAFGLLGGQRDPRQRHALLGVFVAGLIAGLAAIALGTGPTPAEDVLIGAAAIAGLLVARARPLWRAPEWMLAAVVGAATGLDSPPEVVSLRTANLMLIGTGLGATILVALIGQIAGASTRDWQRIGIRVLGSWAAASALLVMALRFAPE